MERVKKKWEAEARERPKLLAMRRLLAIDGKARCIDVSCQESQEDLGEAEGRDCSPKDGDWQMGWFKGGGEAL